VSLGRWTVDVPNAVVQLFVWHTGERINYVHAPAGSGKRVAVKAWLDGAGIAADQIWLESAAAAALAGLPRRPERPTFVVATDYEPNADFETSMLRIIAETPPQLAFVITSTHPPSPQLAVLEGEGLVRITTKHDLAKAFARGLATGDC
jgi:ATP/maltotriose-dependent transcriptional regulator MalT